ncbi:hypothetical protein AC579_4647 [Pseudocercospora musae]|uniref:Uncharacterized protein n=1 Tax=Pseudocercospora musae TaxID=113226 RepID=A0A139IBG4_9PEZI|nr:hypothetical protein AC579_4647 [Pseudocercospora musae]
MPCQSGHVQSQAQAAVAKARSSESDGSDINQVSSTSCFTRRRLTTPTYPPTTPPTFNSTSHTLPNAGAGGQGTFYHSSYFNSYVWIGKRTGIVGSSAAFFISTAPAPEGPWVQPYQVWEGQNGDNDQAPSYSLQAHPSLLPSGPDVAREKGIYLSWTQKWKEQTCRSVHVTLGGV